jgi:hypothetical protein
MSKMEIIDGRRPNNYRRMDAGLIITGVWMEAD